MDHQVRCAVYMSPGRCNRAGPTVFYGSILTGRVDTVIIYNCAIQEGVIPEDQREILSARLVEIGGQILGIPVDDITVDYEVIPHGFGFRGGEISSSSAVRSRIPDGFSQEKRVEFMQAVQDMWIEVTGQTTAELVVGAADASYQSYPD